MKVPKLPKLEVRNKTDSEDGKGRNYTSCYWCIGRNTNKNHVYFGRPGYYGKLAKITGRDLLFCQIGTRIYNQL